MSEPIQIRATIINRRFSDITAEWMIDGRFEIRWSPDEPWLNLGLAQFSDLEWRLLTSLMELGARRVGPDVIKFMTTTHDPAHEVGA